MRKMLTINILLRFALVFVYKIKNRFFLMNVLLFSLCTKANICRSPADTFVSLYLGLHKFIKGLSLAEIHNSQLPKIWQKTWSKRCNRAAVRSISLMCILRMRNTDSRLIRVNKILTIKRGGLRPHLRALSPPRLTHFPDFLLDFADRGRNCSWGPH